MSALLVAQDVSRRFGGLLAVSGLSFEVREGEVLGLIGDRFGLDGPVWRFIAMLTDNFGMVGYSIVGFFIVCWIASYLIYRAGGLDRLEAQEAKTSPRG